MQKQILHALRRTPRLGKSWRYVPLHELPVGTVMQLETIDEKPPGELEDRELNHSKTEYDVLRLPAGTYTLEIGPVASATLTYPDGVTEDVRPLTRCLAPTGPLSVNVDRPKDEKDRGHDDTWSTTFRLVTGQITSIYFPQAGITLHKNDLEQFQRRQDERRRDYERRRRRGGRNRRARTVPLRERWK